MLRLSCVVEIIIINKINNLLFIKVAAAVMIYLNNKSVDSRTLSATPVPPLVKTANVSKTRKNSKRLGIWLVKKHLRGKEAL